MNVFDPQNNSQKQEKRGCYGYVARAALLPIPIAQYEGIVLFCSDTKAFYECQKLTGTGREWYEWVEVAYPRRLLIPVEKILTEAIDEGAEDPSARKNSFDAIISAVNAIAVGMIRYRIQVDPLGYIRTRDSVYKAGKNYFVWNENYDRSAYVVTEDEERVPEKTYFVRQPDWVYRPAIASDFNSDGSFKSGVFYYEMTRPTFVPDTHAVVDDPILCVAFEFVGHPSYDETTMKDVISKANELIEIVNRTDAHIALVNEDISTLFDLAKAINSLIDEVNPFSVPWNQLHDRVAALEHMLPTGSRENPLNLPFYFNKKIVGRDGSVSLTCYALDIVEESGVPKMTVTKVD